MKLHISLISLSLLSLSPLAQAGLNQEVVRCLSPKGDIKISLFADIMHLSDATGIFELKS